MDRSVAETPRRLNPAPVPSACQSSPTFRQTLDIYPIQRSYRGSRKSHVNLKMEFLFVDSKSAGLRTSEALAQIPANLVLSSAQHPCFFPSHKPVSCISASTVARSLPYLRDIRRNHASRERMNEGQKALCATGIGRRMQSQSALVMKYGLQSPDF